MTTILKHRRGTTAQHASFTGALGEITVDTDKDTAVVHDGSTVGGFPLLPKTMTDGTANGVLYLNGSKVATSGSALKFDGTDFVLASGGLLDIDGTSGSTALRIRQTTAGAGTEFSTTITENTGVTFDCTDGGTTARSFIWTQVGSEQMRLTSTGLGIGTSSPAAKLQVSGGRSYFFAGSAYSVALAQTLGQANYMYLGTDTSGNLLISESGGSAIATLTQSGNLGLGVTPSAWSSEFRTMQIGLGGAVYGRTVAGDGDKVGMSANVYKNTSFVDTYIITDSASKYDQAGGAHYWYTAPSGNAGDPITFTQAMTLDASGRLLIGGTTGTAGGRLTVTTANGGYAAIEPTSSVTSQIATGLRLHGNINETDRYVGIFCFNGAANNVNSMTFWTTNSGVSSERMRLDNLGNLGIGTTSISNRLTIGDSGGVTMRLRDNTSGNFSIIESNSVGSLGLSADHGNTGSASNMNFSVDGTERMRIDSSGNLLVAKTAANANTVGAELRATGRVVSTMSASTSADDSYELYSTGAGAYRFYVNTAGTIYATSTTISAISDIRYKENVRDLDVGLDKVMALKPRLYDWKEGKGANIKNARGFIAQEFEQVFPDLIDEWKDPAPEGEEPYKSVRQDLIPVLVKAIQEQQAIIQQLTARVAQLESN